MSWRRPVAIGAAVVALQAAAVLGYRAIERGRAAPAATRFEVDELPRRAAPELELEHRDGRRERLSGLADRTVLLHFWATWCTPCAEELPALLDFAARHPEAALVAVTVDEGWAPVDAFFHGRVPDAVVRAASEAELRDYDPDPLPQTLFLRRGELASKAVGARDWRSDAALTVLQELP
jgi:thiol-disulfide isomerase/thioredoxin